MERMQQLEKIIEHHVSSLLEKIEEEDRNEY